MKPNRPSEAYTNPEHSELRDIKRTAEAQEQRLSSIEKGLHHYNEEFQNKFKELNNDRAVLGQALSGIFPKVTTGSEWPTEDHMGEPLPTKDEVNKAVENISAFMKYEKEYSDRMTGDEFEKKS